MLCPTCGSSEHARVRFSARHGLAAFVRQQEVAAYTSFGSEDCHHGFCGTVAQPLTGRLIRYTVRTYSLG
jgi:hypothetical protein